ncbi:hypothetical protein [Verticiella sediminum]|uniref:hypothetical protein n=1 Tax=Verticiella sediminum TaxID=1247510 RepID=UPI0031E6DE26
MDTLVQVRLREGASAHLLIHVEVQARPDAAFLKRMYTYHCRLWDRYGRHDRQVIHVAVLTRSAAHAPTLAFRDAPLQAVAGSAGMAFAVLHLLAWRERRDELLGMARHNPFAVVVLAEIDSAAAGGPETRLARKTRLLCLLYEYTYGDADVNRLFTFIDGVLTLPRVQARRFNETVDAIEKEYDVAYVTSVERIGIEKGLAQGRGEGRHEGLRQALSSLLERRFGPLPTHARERVQTASVDTLQIWLLRVLDAAKLDDVFED